MLKVLYGTIGFFCGRGSWKPPQHCTFACHHSQLISNNFKTYKWVCQTKETCNMCSWEGSRNEFGNPCYMAL